MPQTRPGVLIGKTIIVSDDIIAMHPLYRNLPAVFIFLGLLIATAAELVYHAGAGIVTGYTHIYYLMIILAAYYYRFWGVAVGGYLGSVHIMADIALTGSVTGDAVIRAASFIAAGLLSAALASGLRAETPVSEVIQNSMCRVRARMVSEKDIIRMRQECDIPSLLAILTFGEMDTRYAAIDALGRLRDPRAIEPLIESLRSDAYSGLRWKAAEALARIGSPAVGPLLSLLSDPDEDVRWKVAIALGEIRDPRAIDPLLSLLSDPDSYVRSRAALALATIGEPAVSDLIASLGDEDPVIRASASSALGIVGNQEAIPALITALSDPDDRVRSEVISALSRIGSSVIPPLIEAIWAAPPDLRPGLLLLSADPGTVSPLIEMIEEADPDLRRELAMALQESGDSGLSVFIEELKKEVPSPGRLIAGIPGKR